MVYGYAAAAYVAGRVREHIEDWLLAFFGEKAAVEVDSWEHGHEEFLAGLLAAACNPEGRGLGCELRRETGVVHVDANACDDCGAFELRQNARAFFISDENVIGPAEIARDICRLLNGFRDRQAEG